MACAAMSVATMYHYQWGIGIFLAQKTAVSSYIVEKDTKFEFTDQENTMLAISSLAILFSIIEIIFAFASTKSCSDTGYELLQENQVRIVTDRTKNNVYFMYNPTFLRNDGGSKIKDGGSKMATVRIS